MFMTPPLGTLVKQFRSQRLQALLIITAMALGMGALTAVATILRLNQSAAEVLNERLSTRTITLVPTLYDARPFVATPGASPLDARRLGPVASAPVVTLTADGLARARKDVPAVQYAFISAQSYFPPPQGSQGYLSMNAVTPEYLQAAKIQVTQGSLLTGSDFSQERKVALVSEHLLKVYGISGSPIGQQFAFTLPGASPQSYTIAGVLAKYRDDQMLVGQPYGGPDAIVPFSPQGNASALTLLRFTVKDVKQLSEAKNELQAFINQTWGDGVSLETAVDLSQYQARRRQTQTIMALFASIGLVVAALNIMNLMLARVAKRSRDIGINRSLGATRGAILRRFLAEALLLGLLGGLLGLAASYGVLAVYQSYMRSYYASISRTFSIHLSWPAVVIGLVAALVMSVLFGLYPAWLASRTKIVEALREL